MNRLFESKSHFVKCEKKRNLHSDGGEEAKRRREEEKPALNKLENANPDPT